MNNILKINSHRFGAILLTVLLSMFSHAAMAQGTRVSGTVSDEMGPVMMANVVERDGNNRIINATTTDFNGNFALAIKSPKNKLVISYVGNKTVTLPLNGKQKVFKIFMESETQLQEVVVKAVKKTDVGGLNIPVKEMTVATQTFNMEDVEGLAFTSADEALQGEIAGLDIVANSGNLGAGTQMRLRGVTTINGDANPLIVVDDKIFDNPDETFDFANATEEQYASLLSVNVDDIAKIDVLKDAAATAVWGAYGANGVIQITTKRGIRGKTKVNASYKFTGTWMPKGYKLLNGDDYTMLLKEEFYNPSQSSAATATMRELNYDKSWAEYENWNNNTDWVKEVSDFGKLHNINLNITGGGEKATFRISGSYDNQTGSIIKQKLDRLTTRLTLDYDVSDRIRFSTNFALTYTNNQKNYTDLLAIAQKLSPNMAVYRQDQYGNDTGEFYIMNPEGDPTTGNYSSVNLRAMRNLGNPVAIAHQAWKKESTYRITPDFLLKYELLGKDPDKHRLTLSADVDFDIYANSSPTWHPASLNTGANATGWTATDYNSSSSSESNRFKIGAEGKLTFTPHFNNEDWSASALLRYQMHTSKYNSQGNTLYGLPAGITSPTVNAGMSTSGMTNSTSRSADENILFNAHASYKSIYNLGFSMRMDGNSKFGPSHKWAAFPGISGRYNISDEKFVRSWLPEVISLFGIRASWGINGRAPTTDYLYYNKYNTSAGYYGKGSVVQYGSVDGMKLDDLRWEKTTSLNIGANLNFFEDKLTIDFDYYRKNTSDLLMTGVGIPSSTGYSSLSWYNVGKMTNNGWEVNVSGRDFIKIGKKFSISASFNMAQNVNNIKEMDERVLSAINTEWDYSSRGTYLNRIQENNPLGSIYGYRYKGVYQYTYSYLENMKKENNWDADQYRNWINSQLAEGKTFPVVTDANGQVVMNNQGSPQRMAYYYNEGASTYEFNGGDAIYEDINHDGQIDKYDIVYLGNSMPKFNGGFSITLKYGKWKLIARFSYRYGNKIVNAARMNLENMYTTNNQTATVNYRWRKDGDVTPIPRALYNVGYNWQGSSRYVEDGSFLRFQNLQLSYSFPQKAVKKLGMSSLALYFSVNNIYCWTKYSGVDPEVSIGGWGVAQDNSKTPRTRQFTASINIGF